MNLTTMLTGRTRGRALTAVLAAGLLAGSALLAAAPAHAAVPSAPSVHTVSVTATTIDPWWDPVAGADSYEIQLDDNGWVAAATIPGPLGSLRLAAEFAGLPDGTQHRIGVRAINADGTGPATFVEGSTSGWAGFGGKV